MKMTWLILVIFELMLSFSANCLARSAAANMLPTSCPNGLTRCHSDCVANYKWGTYYYGKCLKACESMCHH